MKYCIIYYNMIWYDTAWCKMLYIIYIHMIWCKCINMTWYQLTQCNTHMNSDIISPQKGILKALRFIWIHCHMRSPLVQAASTGGPKPWGLVVDCWADCWPMEPENDSKAGISKLPGVENLRRTMLIFGGVPVFGWLDDCCEVTGPHERGWWWNSGTWRCWETFGDLWRWKWSQSHRPGDGTNKKWFQAVHLENPHKFVDLLGFDEFM